MKDLNSMADWKIAKNTNAARQTAEEAFTKRVPASRLTEADEAKIVFDANREKLRAERIAREQTAAASIKK